MTHVLSVSEVEEEIARRIAALNSGSSVSNYDQGSASAEWTEAERFGEVDDGPASIAHLLFWVFTESSPNTGLRRDAPCDYARLRSRVAIVFSYALRPPSQIEDARLARDAAGDILKAVNAAWSEANVEIVDAGLTAINDDGTYLGVTILLDVLHEIEV